MNNSIKHELDAIKKHDLEDINIRDLVKKENQIINDLLFKSDIMIQIVIQDRLAELSYISLIKSKVKFKKDIYLGNHIMTFIKLYKASIVSYDYFEFRVLLLSKINNIDHSIVNIIEEIDNLYTNHKLDKNRKLLNILKIRDDKFIILLEDKEIQDNLSKDIYLINQVYVYINEINPNKPKTYMNLANIDTEITDSTGIAFTNLILIILIIMCSLILPIIAPSIILIYVLVNLLFLLTTKKLKL